MLWLVEGFFRACLDFRDRASLHAQVARLKHYEQLYIEAEQATKIARAELEVAGVTIDGLTAVVEQYRQEQLAQARTFATKAQPLIRHDDDIIR